jgi:hypothetical protein
MENKTILSAMEAHGIAMKSMNGQRHPTEYEIILTICDGIREDASRGCLSAVYTTVWLSDCLRVPVTCDFESVATFLCKNCGYSVVVGSDHNSISISWVKGVVKHV